MSLIEIITAISGLLAGTLGTVMVSVLRAARQARQFRYQRRLIGIYHSVVPEELRVFMDFTSYEDFIKSGVKTGILHLRHLSYGLRHCDFVIGDPTVDPKMISPSDSDRIKAIAGGLHV